MNDMIIRLYATAEAASAAVASVSAYAAYTGRITTVGPDAPDVVAALMKARMVRSTAERYAAGVRKGGTLVIVHPIFGTAGRAMMLLDAAGPIDSGVPAPRPKPYGIWNEAAPLSDLLNFPVLSRSAAPFSRMWALPVLAEPKTTTGKWGWTELTPSQGAPRMSFGMPTSVRCPTPLSSMLGLPTLTRSRAY
jgi:hypothetical protein